MRLDFRTLFGNDRPVVLEIGSGKGRFLLDHARKNPGLGVVGIEKSLHYYRVIVRRIERSGLTNVKIVNYDAHPVLAAMIPDRSLSAIHIYFPDPWPRPRERKRRIIRDEVTVELDRALTAAGIGIYVTDHREYFDEAVAVLEKYFELSYPDPGEDRASRTNYEEKYLREGRAIYEVRFSRRG
ncbi:MAG TPA: tRNA (guanosine(46)-N7)-methyltransferase TrmB [Thermoanaerobaculia bacterium]|nr:tRNA (guanosine(46)-N7)-methyltransferase TrmB [Thermoanaerobaculia bacterium]